MSSQFSRKRHHVDESFTKSDLWVERSVNYWTCNTSGHVTTTVRGRKQDLSATCRQDHNDATMTESQPSNTSGFFLNTFETNNLNQLQSSTSVVLVIGIDSGAGLGYPIMQVTWSGRVCTSSPLFFPLSALTRLRLRFPGLLHLASSMQLTGPKPRIS